MNCEDYLKGTDPSQRAKAVLVPEDEYQTEPPTKLTEGSKITFIRVKDVLKLEALAKLQVTSAVRAKLDLPFKKVATYIVKGGSSYISVKSVVQKRPPEDISLWNYEFADSWDECTLRGKASLYDIKPGLKTVWSEKGWIASKTKGSYYQMLVPSQTPAQPSYEDLLERYHELMDTKETGVLTRSQEREIEQLERELQRHEAADLDNMIRRDRAFEDSEEIRQLRQLNENIKELLRRDT